MVSIARWHLLLAWQITAVFCPAIPSKSKISHLYFPLSEGVFSSPFPLEDLGLPPVMVDSERLRAVAKAWAKVSFSDDFRAFSNSSCFCAFPLYAN